jgi:hypothetical protein
MSDFKQISSLLSKAVDESVRNFTSISGDIIGGNIRDKKLVSEVAVICSHGTFASRGGGEERGGGSDGGGEKVGGSLGGKGVRETEGVGASWSRTRRTAGTRLAARNCTRAPPRTGRGAPTNT